MFCLLWVCCCLVVVQLLYRCCCCIVCPCSCIVWPCSCIVCLCSCCCVVGVKVVAVVSIVCMRLLRWCCSRSYKFAIVLEVPILAGIHNLKFCIPSNLLNTTS